jgi:hypothetical protein
MSWWRLQLALLSQFDKQGFAFGLFDQWIKYYWRIDCDHHNQCNAAKYKKYLTDVVTRLKSSADSVVTDWNSGYRNSYIANNGTLWEAQ